MTTDLNPADATSWSNWITDFDSTYADFMQNYAALSMQQTYVVQHHPELLAQYQDLMQRGTQNVQKLTALKATRDYVSSWLGWLASGAAQGVNFLESAATNAYNEARAALGLGDLGIAPVVVIGIAAAAAVLVTVAYWVKDTYQFAQRLEALKDQEQRLVAAGVDPATAARQAQQIVDNTLGPAPGSAASIDNNLLGIPWTWIITGAVLVFLGPPLIDAFKERRT